MDTILGMKVTTSALVRPVPVLQISPGFDACTDEFRAEMNHWLLEMFGTKDVAYVIGGDKLVLNHAVLEKAKRLLMSNTMLGRESLMLPRGV